MPTEWAIEPTIVEAAPPGVHANVVPIEKMIEVAKDPRFGDTKALILFETPHLLLWSMMLPPDRVTNVNRSEPKHI